MVKSISKLIIKIHSHEVVIKLVNILYWGNPLVTNIQFTPFTGWGSYKCRICQLVFIVRIHDCTMEVKKCLKKIMQTLIDLWINVSFCVIITHILLKVKLPPKTWIYMRTCDSACLSVWKISFRPAPIHGIDCSAFPTQDSK